MFEIGDRLYNVIENSYYTIIDNNYNKDYILLLYNNEKFMYEKIEIIDWITKGVLELRSKKIEEYKKRFEEYEKKMLSIYKGECGMNLLEAMKEAIKTGNLIKPSDNYSFIKYDVKTENFVWCNEYGNNDLDKVTLSKHRLNNNYSLIPIKQKYKIGDKFKTNEITKLENVSDGIMIQTTKENWYAKITAIYETEEGKKYVLDVEGLSSLFVDEKYLDKLLRI